MPRRLPLAPYISRSDLQPIADVCAWLLSQRLEEKCSPFRIGKATTAVHHEQNGHKRVTVNVRLLTDLPGG